MKLLQLDASRLVPYLAEKTGRFKVVEPIIRPHPSVKTPLFPLASYLYWLFATSETPIPEPFSQSESKEVTTPTHDATSPLQQWMRLAHLQGYRNCAIEKFNPLNFDQILRTIDAGFPTIARVQEQFYLLIGYYYVQAQVFFISLTSDEYVEFEASEISASDTEILVINYPVGAESVQMRRFFTPPVAEQRLEVKQSPPPAPPAVAVALTVVSGHEQVDEITQYIPYKRLINFVEIDAILGGQYSEKELDELYRTFLINERMIEQHNKFPSRPDDSLDDDIRKQTDPYNSLAEVVSNAIDAGSQQVNITIVDGEYYEVNDDGTGMTARILHQKALLPKATTKKDAKESIGRFGVGLLTIHAHLCDEASYTCIDTKAEGKAGIRVRFKLDEHDKRTVLVNSGPSDRQARGTTIRVTSKEVKIALLMEALMKRAGYFTRIPIVVNGVRVNVFSTQIEKNQLAERMLSQSSVLFDPQGEKHETVVRIKGMTFDRGICKDNTNTGLVVWSLPETTRYSEKREGIQVDTDSIRTEIKVLIDYGKTLGKEDAIIYFNTICPLVQRLQRVNSASFEKDNLMEHLKQCVQAVIGRSPQVPDTKEYKMLQIAGRIRLHPDLLCAGWCDILGYQPSEWESYDVKVWVTDIANEEGKVFLYDEEKKWVFLQQKFYEAIKSDFEINVVKLELLFKCYNPSIEGSWLTEKPLAAMVPALEHVSTKPLHAVVQEEKSTATAAGMRIAQTVLPPQEPLRRITARASALAEQSVIDVSLEARYPQLFTTEAQRQKLSELSPEARQVLAKTATLYGLCRVKKSTFNIGSMAEYYYSGKIYFCYKDDRLGEKNLVFVDEQFRVLSNLTFKALAEKCKALYLKGIKSVEVNIAKYERFLDATKERYKVLIDSAGSKVVDHYFSETAELVQISASTVLIQQRDDKIEVTPDCTYTVQGSGREAYIICDDKIVWNHRGEVVFNKACCNYLLVDKNRIYAILQQKMVVSAARKVLVQQEHILFISESGTEIDQEHFGLRESKPADDAGYICNNQGRVIFVFPKPVVQLLADCTDFAIYQSAEMLYVSLVTSRGETHLISSNLNTHKIYLYGPGETFGFPVYAYFHRQGEQRVFRICDEQVERSLQGLQTCHETLRLSIRNTPQTFTVFSLTVNDRKSLYVITPEKMVIKLPEEVSTLNNISTLVHRDGLFIIHYKKFGFIKKNYVVNERGRLIAEGDEIQTTINRAGSFVLVDGLKIIDQNGLVIKNYQYKISTMTACEKLSYVILKTESRGSDELIEANGKMVPCLIGKQYSVSIVDENIFISLKGEDSYLVITMIGIYYGASIANSTLTLRQHQNHTKQPIIPRELMFRNTYLAANQDLQYCEVNFFERPGSSLMESSDEGVFYRLLPIPLLIAQTTLDKFAWLNQQNLSPNIYSLCVRYISLPLQVLKGLLPFIVFLRYVPTPEQAEHYLSAIDYLNKGKFSEEVHSVVMRLVDLCYLIYGHISTSNMAERIICIHKEYGLQRIKIFFEFLKLKQDSLKDVEVSITEKRKVINDFLDVVAECCYFVFFDSEMLFLNEEVELAMPRLSEDQQEFLMSMVALNTATTLRPDIVEGVGHPEVMMAEIRDLSTDLDHEHSLRKLRHAIYHLSDANRMLYIREFLQNGLDAVRAKNLVGSKLHFSIFKNENDDAVLRFSDPGVGMSRAQILLFLCCPGASTKRYQSDKHFIGGRGVGFFTAYQNAIKLIVKTSRGDGITHYCELTPIRGEQDLINDIKIRIISKRETFCGTIIEHHARHATPELLASRYHRAIKGHGALVDSSQVEVFVNNKPINQPLIPLASGVLPEGPRVELYQGSESAITVGGLFVKEFDYKRILALLPDELTKSLTRNGLVLNLVGTIELCRDRSDFENPQAMWQQLTPHVTRLAIEAYLYLARSRSLRLEELPYDFFDEFTQRKQEILIRTPMIMRDVARITYGLPIDYSRYTTMERITDLMVFFRMIPHRQKRQDRIKHYSLIELADLHAQGKLENLEDLPKLICDQITFATSSKTQDVNRHSELSTWFGERVEAVLEKTWVHRVNNGSEACQLFCEISQSFLTVCSKGNEVPELFFSTKNLMAVAFASLNRISWNIVNVYSVIENLWKALKDKDHIKFTRIIILEMLKTLAHEKTHTQDEHCSGTHNKAFDLRIHGFLVLAVEKIDLRKLFQHCYDKYLRFLSVPQKSLKEYLCLQFNLEPSVESTAQATIRRVFSGPA